MARSKSKTRSKKSPLSIHEPLKQLEDRLHTGGRHVTGRMVARETGIAESTYSGLKNERRNVTPTLHHLLELAKFYSVPVDAFLGQLNDLNLYERSNIHWRVRGHDWKGREQALRYVASQTLSGASTRAIAKGVHPYLLAEDRTAALPDSAAILAMARGGLGLGLVELVLSPEASEIEDENLAGELQEALVQHAPVEPNPTVRVVRNLADASFGLDPVAPFLIARVAHRVVADHFTRERNKYTLGIAGGVHLAYFVRTIGASSSPFPQLVGSDRRFHVVPMTLEPFLDHRLVLADALVGELQGKMANLLGPARIEAPSFKPFGVMRNRKKVKMFPGWWDGVRRHYGSLDVAIFGCGASDDDGWISNLLRDLGWRLDPPPATDVCLNMLTRDAVPVKLPFKEATEFVGASLSDVRRVAHDPHGLALLLTSGAHKGLPLTIVARAGCASAIVCDQAAARAALRELRGGAERGRPRRRSQSSRPTQGTAGAGRGARVR